MMQEKRKDDKKVFANKDQRILVECVDHPKHIRPHLFCKVSFHPFNALRKILSSQSQAEVIS